ncbi:GNAT family N-acetyltransferase [Streptomyces palmae]|uniref:GNAT family N-acetyltransferase n=1 Tax=Streptomyces palmae TaxID=1701085 RepID=A0A4Z0HB03_9ACTN|nr:GNAT family N-acetyltransferase [Streptomyces palmae]TGB13893.1 GNAT family N-acetyltransferase [Streptomyces palmae]
MTTELTPAQDLPPGTALRHPTEADHARLQVALTEWWGGLGGEVGSMQRRLMVPRLFLQHFADTSFWVEDADGSLQAFLIGFLSQTDPRTAYIHYVGVHPERRRSGLGSALYHRFFALVQEHGRDRVRCLTGPNNLNSIAYHQRMGFRVEPGERTEDGVPVQPDYDGPGLDRVTFVRDL